MQGAKAPVIGFEEIPVSVRETEAMTLPLDPSLKEGEDIESVISLRQTFPFFFFTFFMLFLLPPSLTLWPMSNFSPFCFSFLLKAVSG